MKYILICTFLTLGVISCSKKETAPDQATAHLSYGDSVFYLKSSSYEVFPQPARSGNYASYPEGLDIDPVTGKITVSVKDRDGDASQTGLRYRVIFTPASGSPDTTYVMIAGVNYQDKLYYLSQDTLVRPIYNADLSRSMPQGSFESSNNKLVIDPNTGVINLKKSIQKGIFNDDPQNSAWREVNIKYKLADGTTSDKNNLDIIVYYYTSVAVIPSNVSTAMRVHQDQLLGLAPQAIPTTFAPVDNDIKNIVSLTKPRPPCIIIIGN